MSPKLRILGMRRKPRKNDPLPGSLDMLILRTLSRRDLHGYGMVQFLQQSSDNELLVEEGSLRSPASSERSDGHVDTTAEVSDGRAPGAANNVARQVGEIGIRMALGAQQGAVLWMVLRRVLLLAGVELAISVPAALVASRLVRSFLFDTQPNAPETLVLAGAVLLSAAILAGYAPASRASRIDPMAALRQE